MYNIQIEIELTKRKKSFPPDLFGDLNGSWKQNLDNWVFSFCFLVHNFGFVFKLCQNLHVLARVCATKGGVAFSFIEFVGLFTVIKQNKILNNFFKYFLFKRYLIFKT